MEEAAYAIIARNEDIYSDSDAGGAEEIRDQGEGAEAGEYDPTDDPFATDEEVAEYLANTLKSAL